METNNSLYDYQGWGPRGLSSTLRTARGQKVVALALASKVLALALVLNSLYSNTSLTITASTYRPHNFEISKSVTWNVLSALF